MIATFTRTQPFDGALRQAVAHHQAGRLQEAERLYRSILQAYPNQADANHNMGLLAMQLGQPASGLPYFEKAWKNNPADEQFCLMLADCLLQLDRPDDALRIIKNAMQRKGFKSDQARNLLQLAGSIVSGERPLLSVEHEALALFNAKDHSALEVAMTPLTKRYPNWDMGWQLLGLALLSQNRDGLTALRRAVELNPANAEGYYNLGLMLNRQGQASEAEDSYRRALKIRPNYAEAHYNLGVMFDDQGRIPEAEASYRNTLKIKPDCAEAHNNLGIIFQEQGRFIEAESSFRRALEIRPDYVEAHNGFGCILREQGNLHEAEASVRRALEIKPDYAGAHSGLACILREQGNFHEAEASFRRALEIKPDFLAARLDIALTRKAKVGDENLAALVAADEAARNSKIPLPGEDAAYLHFALGKSYDDIGDHEKAFPHFLEGNRLKRATFDYNPDQAARLFDSITRNFDAAAIERLRGGGDLSRLPIFILGMPRSGTTLIEQIIASHPEVHGAGELPDLMGIAMRNVAGAAYPDNVRLMDRVRLAAWGAEYVAGLQRRAPDARRITDKMPENFLAIGLIHVMLPNAKIIHVSRNPVDTCLSCFNTLFMHKQKHTYDLSELGRYYAGYARLMEHWRQVLPEGAFLDVRYEDIVSDQEAQSRRIIECCGLEWDDVCLDFHRSKRAVRTASMTQVRQPMYKSSVERWRPYGKFLKPLLDALGELAPDR